ncbi:MAG: hypothetical protein JWO40_871 [Candidatus Doudnabacteria bacterium]|nr:hypothetical protein [Candidatus Doudnabacteria bacterium]
MIHLKDILNNLALGGKVICLDNAMEKWYRNLFRNAAERSLQIEAETTL